jgi:hypothetical protein
LIVAYKEDVSELEAQLTANDLRPTVLRGVYTPDELRLPANTRTFMNHRNAWRIAASNPGYTLICEADFVPCQSIGTLPVFWPLDRPFAWGYLYQGSPRLLSLVGSEPYLRGQCAPLVAYIVNAQVAEVMLRFFEHAMAAHDDGGYFTFDAHLQWWVMGEGAEAYIPPRHYGEHGGTPNTEHRMRGRLSRSGRHRADNLARPLAFLPQYAAGSRHAYWRERVEARAYGWARLFSGRWIVDTNAYTRDMTRTTRMYLIGARRLLPNFARARIPSTPASPRAR